MRVAPMHGSSLGPTLSRPSGSKGTRVVIGGANFGVQGCVLFGAGLVPGKIESWESTRIVVLVPDDASEGRLNVTVEGEAFYGEAVFKTQFTCPFEVLPKKRPRV